MALAVANLETVFIILPVVLLNSTLSELEKEELKVRQVLVARKDPATTLGGEMGETLLAGTLTMPVGKVVMGMEVVVLAL